MENSFVKKQSNKEIVKKRFILNQRKITFTFSIMILFVSILLFFHVFQSNELVALVNEKEKLKRKIQELEKIRENYKQREVSLGSLQRVEFVARDQLGMVSPGQSNRYYLKKDNENQ
jgi:cell division protein FtsL